MTLDDMGYMGAERRFTKLIEVGSWGNKDNGCPLDKPRVLDAVNPRLKPTSPHACLEVIATMKKINKYTFELNGIRYSRLSDRGRAVWHQIKMKNFRQKVTSWSILLVAGIITISAKQYV